MMNCFFFICYYCCLYGNHQFHLTNYFVQFETQMSAPDQTLQHTIARQEIQPKKVLQEIEVSKQQSINNDSKIEDRPHKSVVKSNSQNSLNNVNLADSVLPEQVDAIEGDQKGEDQDQATKIDDNFYYDDKHLETIHTESPIPEAVVKLDGFYGHDSFKRYNALILDRDSIIYAAGISYTIYNHFTKDKKTFYSKDRGGIGSIAVHPSKKYFAVAEMGVSPNIYIYEYPSLKLYRILRKGTQRSYSSVTFSGSGEMLASVGSDPDFLLTVWQWKQQRLMLKSKAFSQQVYKVSFSQFNQKWLTTSGTGHIRFWKISQTFTGLKLQGDIAKFGQFELSDVTSFAEYQDGNVLSSSQYGKLLLWQGNLIKSVVSISPEKPCHNGQIEFVRHYNKKIITAGADGYIRFWDAQTINQGESDEKFNFYIKPEKEIYFQTQYKQPAYINWIQIQNDYWIVQDAHGSIWKYHPEGDKRDLILSFNSGKIIDFAISPLNNCLVTSGYDGSVRLWDYGNRRQFYNRRFKSNGQATCIDWLPFSKKNNGRVLVVGFSDGIVRFIGLQQKRFALIKAFKVHKNPIIKVKCNREGNIVVVADTAGSLFYLSLDSASSLNKITPYCLFETGFKINDLCWDRTGEKILLACQDGRLHEISTPKERDCDFSQTYLKKFQIKTFVMKMMQSQKPNKEDRELQLLLMKTKGVVVDTVIVDQEWDPAPILNATYYTDNNRILCSVEGNYLGYLYVIDFNKERPINCIEIPKLKTSYLSYSETSDVIFIGYKNGSWEMRHKYEPNNYLRKLCFDQNIGIVRKLALNIDNTAVMSASQDGTLLVHKIDFSTFTKGVKGEYIDSVQISIPSVILGISSANFSDKIDFGKDLDVDIADNSIYCLQDEKLKAEEDMKLSDAQKVKRRKYQKIKELQALFKEIVEVNNSESDSLARLTPEDMVIDPQYAAAFKKRIYQEEEQTRKQLAWDEQYAETKKRKLENYFINSLQFDKFNVKGINKQVMVSSFKMNKLSPYIKKELQLIQKIIQEEQLSSTGDKKDRTVTSFQMSKAMLEMKIKDQKKGKEENQQVKNKIREAENQFEKELANAIATKGDYKLKCSPDYVVPQNERLNVSRKKKHLFLHYQYLFEEKKQFNSRLDRLRLKKRELVQKLDPINQKLRSINKQLGVEQEDIIFEIDEDIELLETEFDVTQEDIHEHILLKQRQKAASKKSSGMGMSAGPDDKDKNQNEGERIKRPKKKLVEKKEEKVAFQIKPRPNLKVKTSALENEILQIKKIKLESQKKILKEQLFKEIDGFDNELQQLKTVKHHLQSDLNLVQMKILTYSQQFIIFRDMQTYDMQLMEQLITHGTQKGNLQANFLQLTTEIADIEMLNQEFKKKYDEEKKILRQFVYPDDDEMRERIIRYYKIRERKRISKLKKQAQLEEKQKESQGDQDQDEDQQAEQQSEESQDEFEDQDEKPDITVIQNDHKNFERVRKICEYDQKIEQYSRKKSELEKQRNQINTKIKNISQSLSSAEKELKAYQKKKLLKINQVLVSLPISFSQIQYTVKMGNKSRIQEDFNNAILFTRPSYNRLGQRIVELQKETIDICKKETNLKKKLKKMTDQVEKASTTIQVKRKEYQEKQLLKFGNTFEMEKLKELEPNDQLIETRDLYKKEEREVSKRIQQIKEQLQQKKRELLQAKKQNTKVINDITQLGDRQNQLKKKLDSTNKQLFKNYDVSKKDQLEKERQNLKDLIKFLSKQIEDLKTEIGLFKRKGGHIYTMVTSNKKNFS